MAQLIKILFLALGLFGVSAGVSWYMREHAQHPAETKEKAAEKGQAAPAAAKTPAPLKPSVRPPDSPEAESVAHLAVNLRQQLEQVKAREQQAEMRHKQLDLIFLDVRQERVALDKLRNEIADEMKRLQEKLEAVENKAAETDMHKQKIAQHAKEIKQSMFELDEVEQDRVKQMATIYDAMEADSAAQVLQQMADNGKIDTAVKILATMKERQAAKVLSQMPDRTITVQLLERLRGLKKTPAKSKS